MEDFFADLDTEALKEALLRAGNAAHHLRNIVAPTLYPAAEDAPYVLVVDTLVAKMEALARQGCRKLYMSQAAQLKAVLRRIFRCAEACLHVLDVRDTTHDTLSPSQVEHMQRLLRGVLSGTSHVDNALNTAFSTFVSSSSASSSSSPTVGQPVACSLLQGDMGAELDFAKARADFDRLAVVRPGDEKNTPLLADLQACATHACNHAHELQNIIVRNIATLLSHVEYAQMVDALAGKAENATRRLNALLFTLQHNPKNVGALCGQLHQQAVALRQTIQAVRAAAPADQQPIEPTQSQFEVHLLALSTYAAVFGAA